MKMKRYWKLFTLLLTIIVVVVNTKHAVNATSLSINLEPITSENVNRLEEIQVVGRGTFLTADVSPDGNTLAVGTTAGVWLYDFHNLAAQPQYLSYGRGYLVEYDTSGRYLQVGSYILQLDQNNQVVDVVQRIVMDGQNILYRGDDPSENPIHVFHLPDDDEFLPSNIMTDMIFSIDQSLVVVRESNQSPTYSYNPANEIRLFDLLLNQYVGSIQVEEKIQLGEFSKLELSDDQTYLFGVVVNWRPATSLALYRWSIRDILESEVTSLESGELLWQTTAARIVDLRVHGNFALITTIPEDVYDPTVTIVDVEDGTVHAQIDNQNVYIHPISGDIIGLERQSLSSLQVINYSTDEVLGTLNDFGNEVRRVVFNANETALLSVNQAASSNWISVTVHLRNLEAWQNSTSLEFIDQVDTLIGFQPDDRAIAIAAYGYDDVSEKRVDIWDVAQNEILFSQSFDDTPFIALSDNGVYLFISAGESRWLYDIREPDIPQLLPLPSNDLLYTTAYFSPDSQQLALVEFDANNRLLRLWNIGEEHEVGRIANRRIVQNPFADGVQWTENSQVLVLCEVRNPRGGANDYQMTFWELEALASQVSSYPTMTIVNAMLCRIDSKSANYVVVPTYGYGIQQWLPSVSKQVETYGSGEYVWWRVARFGPDGTILLGIDYGGLLSIWNMHDPENQLRLPITPPTGEEAPINDLQFINEGELMVIPSGDGTIRFWGVPSVDE
jgi:WD40 repeat protein